MTPLEFITLEEAKIRLKVDFTDEDAFITSLIKSTIEMVENATEQRLYDRDEIVTTYKDEITLYTHPINSIVSVTDGAATPASIDYETTYGWTTTLCFDSEYKDEKKVLTLNVGYAAGTCPESLKEAAMSLIEYKFANRAANDIPPNVEQAIYNYKRLTWF